MGPQYRYGERRIAAVDLSAGDKIHVWSNRGGYWTIVHTDLELTPYITLRSDMGAIRRMTAEQIDGADKGRGASLDSFADGGLPGVHSAHEARHGHPGEPCRDRSACYPGDQSATDSEVA